MRTVTLLNRIEKFKSFVYKKALEVLIADVGGEVFEGTDQTDDGIEDRADEAGGADAGETSNAFIELVQGGRGGVERDGRGSESQGEIDDEKILRFSERRDPANGPVSYPWKTTRTQNHPQILLKSQTSDHHLKNGLDNGVHHANFANLKRRGILAAVDT